MRPRAKTAQARMVIERDGLHGWDAHAPDSIRTGETPMLRLARDRQIYGVYRLTDEEIAVVEEGAK